MNYGNTAPVQMGEELDVQIEAVGEKGDGIARKKGFVLFVPGVQAGDQVRIRITKVLSKVGFAEKIGEAQGPVEKAQPKPNVLEVRQNDYSSRQQEQYEDTEDFGEEDESDDSEETTDDSEDEKKEPLEDSDDESEDSDDFAEDSEKEKKEA